MTVRVLVTGVGGTAGQSVISAIRIMKEPATIVGVDMNPLSAGLYLVDKGNIVPPADNRHFASTLLHMCIEEKIDVLIPTVDEELLPLASVKHSFEESGIKMILVSSNILETALDKWKTYVLLRDAGIPVPKSMLLGNRDTLIKNLGLPLMIKPRKGRGGRDVVKLDDPSLFDYLVSRTKDLFFQECLTGTEYTVDVVASKKGEIWAIVPKKRIEMRGGSTYKAVTVHNEEIEKAAADVASLLKADGPLNIQFKVDARSGQAKVLEINPRFSSTLALTVNSGINSVKLLIKDCLGEPLSPDSRYKFKEGIYLLRYWQNMVLPSSNLLSDLS